MSDLPAGLTEAVIAATSGVLGFFANVIRTRLNGHTVGLHLTAEWVRTVDARLERIEGSLEQITGILISAGVKR